MKKDRGFTLLELMAIVVIIAIIAAFTVPALLAARRASNATNAFGNLRSFASAMTTYSQDRRDQMFPLTMKEAEVYYSHIDPKGGYKYCYFSNGSCFVYYAYPASISNGVKIYYVDESSRIFEAMADPSFIKEPTVDLNESSIGRVKDPALNWQKKS